MKKPQLKDIYTGKIYDDEDVLADAPRHTNRGPIVTFSVGKYISDDDLEKEYTKRGLVPADVYELALWSEQNQNTQFVGTHWKDGDDKWCCASFNRFGGVRYVRVERRVGRVWVGGWSFAGVPQVASSLESSESTLTLESLHLRLEKLEKFFNPELL